MTLVPRDWKIITLKEVTSLISSGSTPLGGAENYLTEGVLFIRSQNVRMNKLVLDDATYIPEQMHKEMRRSHVYKGDVLLNITGASIGRVATYVLDSAANVNQHVCIIRPIAELVDYRYLALYLSRPIFQEKINRSQHGQTRQALTFSQIGRFQIPLPPLCEQQAIVSRLENQLAAIQQVKSQLAATTKLVERYKQTVVGSAFDGELLDATSHDPWPIRTFGEVLHGIEAGKNLRCEERAPRIGEIGVVKVSAVTGGTFKPEEAKTLPVSFQPDPRSLIKAGDLLLSRASGSIGLVGCCVIVDESPGNLYLSDKVLRLRVPDNLKGWILWFLRSPKGRLQIEHLSTGISMNNISQSSLKSIQIPIPSEEQRRTVMDLLHNRIESAAKIEKEVNRAIHLTERLEAVNLDRAFLDIGDESDEDVAPEEPVVGTLAATKKSALVQ